MIRYRHLVKFGFVMSKAEVVNIFHVTQHDHNFWPYCQTTVEQSGYCSRFIQLFNTLNDRVFIFSFTNYHCPIDWTPKLPSDNSG